MLPFLFFVQIFFILLTVHTVFCQNKLDAVILTTGKDIRVFEKSIQSGLIHLVDVDKFYIVSPNADDLKTKLLPALGPRVIFVDENTFPFHANNVSEVMFNSVRQRGLYPMDGNSPFEKAVWGKLGWFLQQVLKLTAGTVLGLNDYVLLDSDIVWFKNISFINSTIGNNVSFNYASSTQYHPAYMAILKRISNVDLLKNQPLHRSGICHHMVIAKEVMKNLIQDSESLHQGLPFWQIVLNQSAIELTCRAPKLGICGGGSTLSEYELYFNYARSKHPETVSLRPLLWANGPSPGLLFWPQQLNALQSDGGKGNWRSHRQNEIAGVLERQIEADKAQGFDFVAYHAYAKRRYFELHQVDVDALCHGTQPPRNTTCSWNGYDPSSRNTSDWFGGCACYMSTHTSWG